jgi:hypothetical protein
MTTKLPYVMEEASPLDRRLTLNEILDLVLSRQTSASQQMLQYFGGRSGKHNRSAADHEKVGDDTSLPLRLFWFLPLLRMMLLILSI